MKMFILTNMRGKDSKRNKNKNMTFVILGEATNHVMWLRFGMDNNLYIQHDPCTLWSFSCACFFMYMFLFVCSCSMIHGDMVFHVHSGANSHICFVHGNMGALQGHSWPCFMFAWLEYMNMGHKTGVLFLFGACWCLFMGALPMSFDAQPAWLNFVHALALCFFIYTFLVAMGHNAGNVPSEAYMELMRDNEWFVLEEHPPNSYIRCVAVGCDGTRWIWTWRLSLRNQRCRNCRAWWLYNWSSDGYRFWPSDESWISWVNQTPDLICGW